MFLSSLNFSTEGTIILRCAMNKSSKFKNLKKTNFKDLAKRPSGQHVYGVSKNVLESEHSS